MAGGSRPRWPISSACDAVNMPTSRAASFIGELVENWGQSSWLPSRVFGLGGRPPEINSDPVSLSADPVSRVQERGGDYDEKAYSCRHSARAGRRGNGQRNGF